CRIAPPRRAGAVLGFFGIDTDPATGIGDLLVVGGGAAALILLGLERLGRSVDGLLVVDALASGLGVGLAVAWGLARATARARVPEVASAQPARALFTEIEPDLGRSGPPHDPEA